MRSAGPSHSDASSPFREWGLFELESPSPLGRLTHRACDRASRLIEDLLDEDIDARISRMPHQLNELGFDRFGWDPHVARYVMHLVALVHRKYFRTEVYGADNMPPRGRQLIVANHSGQIPIDGTLLAAAMCLDREPPRLARSMIEKWLGQVPFANELFTRCAQVVGAPENAKRLLEQDEALIVFPEGVSGISKTFDRRYHLEAFGMGFMRLALETGTPIVPCAVIGGEEQYISVANLTSLARALGMPAFPLVPQVFVGMPFPLPTKYRLHFGEPLYFEGDPDDDDDVIGEKVAFVRAVIQNMVNRGVKERPHVFV